MIRNYLVENPLLMKEMGLVRVKLEESFDRIFWRYIECRAGQNQSWKSTLLQLVNFEKCLVVDVMGDNFFQKSLSFQLPLMRLQKSQYQILRVILEK